MKSPGNNFEINFPHTCLRFTLALASHFLGFIVTIELAVAHGDQQCDYYEFNFTAFTIKLRLGRYQFIPFPPQLWNQTCPSQ